MSDNSVFGYFPFIPITNSFIEEDMPKANPLYVIIYIYLLKKYINKEEILLSLAAEKLDILASDIIKCLNYWQNENLLKFTQDEDTLNITFFNNNLTKNNFAQTNTENIKQKDKLENIIENIEDNIDNIKNKIENKKIIDYFRIAENKLATTLTHDDRCKIADLIEFYGINKEVFAALLTYCKDKGKTKFRYIEKVAIDWLENDIDSIEKVEDYINMTDNDSKVIMNALGYYNRKPIDNQLKCIKRWLIDFKIPLDVVEFACKDAVMKVGTPNFGYINKIMENFKKEGVKTIAKAEELFKKYHEENKTINNKLIKKAKANSPSVPTKFNNYDQPNLDFKMLRELEILSLRKDLE